MIQVRRTAEHTLSDNPVVACGSHNLGYKASYGNDENPSDHQR
jgi:hypothetical protein